MTRFYVYARIVNVRTLSGGRKDEMARVDKYAETARTCSTTAECPIFALSEIDRELVGVHLLKKRRAD